MIESEAGEKVGDFWEIFSVGSPEVGGVGDRVEGFHDAPGISDEIGDAIESQEGLGKGGTAGVEVTDGLKVLFCRLEQGIDSGRDLTGSYRTPRDGVLNREVRKRGRGGARMARHRDCSSNGISGEASPGIDKLPGKGEFPNYGIVYDLGPFDSERL